MDMMGVVNVIEGENSCRTGSEVGAFTYSGILVDDFVPSKPGGCGWSCSCSQSFPCIRGRIVGCH